MSDFKIKATADLDTSPLEAKLMALQNRKITIQANANGNGLSNMNNSLQQIQNNANNVSASLKGIATTKLKVDALNFLKNQTENAVRSVTDLNKAMTLVNMTMSNMSGSSLYSLKQQSLSMAKDLSAATKTVTDAVTIYANENESVSSMLNKAQPTVLLSAASGMSSSSSADAIQGILNQFNLSEDQADFFECSAGTFYNNLFVVAINTGLRPGELFALTEDDIDFEKNEIKVNKTLLYQKLDGDTQKEFHIDPPKTKSSYRTVPINSFCKEALQEQIILHKIICDNSPYKGKLDFPDLLFTTKFGTPLNSQLYLQAIGRIVDEINLTKDPLDAMEKFSGHTFRHTFATRCFEAGIPPKTVQSYLGHASLQMTMDLYTSVLDKKKVDDMKLLEDTIGLEKTNSSSLTGKIIQFGA